ncbi:putative methyltransferase type 11 [Gottschalkia acidurici 9a]|uniref:Methyltransferase type 11 n=1 Tax=Gottschalkia acidurici (strain ATCC 7906 / DSM 604 / BCRC 14475 / CIP 104303 / KCTC 5404 / NCIMB 10678 / 9a) TaxID=1128398 RepID=K0B1Y3_GOTA9|nr:class I SAM-dependent methyltransferase [Gottschalkia acidurici]AFS78925.1 putative methyltransferase type 11 [Gottschalkia acidurici 9a]
MKNKFEKSIYKFDEMATNVFSEIYPVIARQAMERTSIREGICIDIGSGGGHLGIAISEITDMKVYLYDRSYDAKEIAEVKIKDKKIGERVKGIVGDVHTIPIEDNTIDLIVSRASYHSWESKVRAIKEIYRVLRYGGKAYIGGGYGSKQLEEKIEDKMIKRNAKGWIKGKKKKESEARKKKSKKL